MSRFINVIEAAICDDNASPSIIEISLYRGFMLCHNLFVDYIYPHETMASH